VNRRISKSKNENRNSEWMQSNAMNKWMERSIKSE
jgi:hypothetical protein